MLSVLAHDTKCNDNDPGQADTDGTSVKAWHPSDDDHLMDAYGGRGYDCSLSDILKSNLEFQHRKNYFKSIYDENFYQTRIKLDDFPHEKQYSEYEI